LVVRAPTGCRRLELLMRCRYCPVIGLGWTLADHHRRIDDAALPAVITAAVRLTPGPPGTQRPEKFSPQFTSSLHVEGLVDGFVHQVPLRPAGELDR